MTTHEIDLDALKALVNDRWKMVEESKQLGDSEGVIWDDDEMARYEYLRHQISKGDAELAIAFPALVARIEAAERERDAAMAALNRLRARRGSSTFRR